MVPNLSIKRWPVLGQCLGNLVLEELVLVVVNIFLQMSIYFAQNFYF